MIRRLINTLLYGDSKTKGFLWSVLFVSLAAAGLFAGAFVSGYFTMLIPAFLLGSADAVLMNRYRLSSAENKGGSGQREKYSGQQGKYSGKWEKDSGQQGKYSGKWEKDSGQQGKESGQQEKYSEQKEKESGQRENYSEQKEKGSEHREKDGGYLQRYTETELKKQFHRFKVKKEHYPILIDRSDKLGISECPAYIWKDKKGIHLFLLEEEPRRAEIKPGSFTELTCRKNVPANSSVEYKELRKAPFVNLVFGKLMPEYIRDGYAGHFTEKKNLYGFSEDIYVTAASAKVFLDVFALPFNPPGAELLLKDHSKYFVEARKLMMLWQDGIYSGGEYKTGIKAVLNRLCTADMTYFEFSDVLDDMVRSRLITDEYAEHFRDLRESLKKKPSK